MRDVVADRAEPALFRAWPQLREQIPWVSLGRLPTRVHRLEGLVPPSVELWVKRDDESGTIYGGNKVRKLEFLLGEAVARGAKRVATIGGIGSHHVLATALYAQTLGLACEAVVFPQPVTEHVREQLLADVAAGAHLVATRNYLGVPPAVWRSRSPRDAMWIAAGGSSVTGSLGYVSAGLELLEQIRAGELPRPDVVYVPLGSCGTVAGLAVGLWGEPAIEIRAVRVVDWLVSNLRVARRLAAGVEERLDATGKLARAGVPPTLEIEHAYFGGAYGCSTPAAEAAMARAREVGLRLETTYTGKCMAALLADADAGILHGKKVLFWHTYNGVDLAPLLARSPGVPALPPLLQRHFEKA